MMHSGVWQAYGFSFYIHVYTNFHWSGPLDVELDLQYTKTCSRCFVHASLNRSSCNLKSSATMPYEGRFKDVLVHRVIIPSAG